MKHLTLRHLSGSLGAQPEVEVATWDKPSRA
jgi:hypothetical protein